MMNQTTILINNLRLIQIKIQNQKQPEAKADFLPTMISEINRCVENHTHFDDKVLSDFVDRCLRSHTLTLLPLGEIPVKSLSDIHKDTVAKINKEKFGNENLKQSDSKRQSNNVSEKRKLPEQQMSDKNVIKKAKQDYVFLPRNANSDFEKPSGYNESKGMPWCRKCGIGHPNNKHYFQNGKFIGPSRVKNFVINWDKTNRKIQNKPSS